MTIHLSLPDPRDDDGGAAFPYVQMSEATGQPINGCFAPGMSLRDYFAAKGMHAQLSDHVGMIAMMNAHDGHLDKVLHHVAMSSYQASDAMLAARQAVQP